MTLTEQQADILFTLQDENGVFETLIEACYSSILKPGDSCVDGGAHVGMHTLPMARLVGRSGTVFAFEPLTQLAACITEATKKMPQVKVFENALSYRDGDTTFHVMTDEPWLSGIARRFADTDKTVEVITVPRFRLDVLADEPIRFMKLDLESGEYHALLGGMELLSQQRPVVAMECGRSEAASAAGFSADEFFALFDEVGYKLHDLFGRPFSRSDFARPWTDRFVPHYLVAAPEAVDHLVARLQANAQGALNGASAQSPRSDRASRPRRALKRLRRSRST